MGICDLIPGISGGTIALVTGIYSRLIKSVRNISPYLFMLILKQAIFPDASGRDKIKRQLEKIDIKFLLILFSGIAFAIITFSKIVNFLLLNYFAYTISFFIGLVLASSALIFAHTDRHGVFDVAFGLLGLIAGGLFVFIRPIDVEPGYLYLFFGGFFAVNAMFLPGISGAFILLILGLYEFMVKVLANIAGFFNYFFVFAAGALFGAFTISRLVTFFLKKQKNRTFYFLLGLIIGSLGVPLRKIAASGSGAGLVNILIIISFFILGNLVFVIFNLAAKKSIK